MRTPAILIATVILSATTAYAAPRSLSTGEPQTIELPTHKVQVLEAPKVQLAPEPAAAQQSEPARSAPIQAAPAETKATETAPAQVAPAAAPPVETKPVEAKPVETKPVRQAQRKPKQRHVGIDQRIHRELRGVERAIIGMSIGYAVSGAGLYW